MDKLDGTQAGGVGGLGADVCEGGQGLGDQKTRVPSGSPDGAVGCSAGHLSGISGPAQSVEGVGGRAQGEQNIGSRVRVRHGEDVENVHEITGLISDDLRQRDPPPHCGSLQHVGA